ncbi:hypothetical protein [Rothia sp. (in: high G+C Gram-positive bacteria)]|uniref:hypothetical protein n=1 Tax=Rothia sp. (in: high G+C Gram-positive bacteria) TaxID=1885016 RepID=UPI003218065B
MGTRHFFRKASAVSAQEALELWLEARAVIFDVRATNLLTQRGFESASRSRALIGWRAAGGPLEGVTR